MEVYDSWFLKKCVVIMLSIHVHPEIVLVIMSVFTVPSACLQLTLSSMAHW